MPLELIDIRDLSSSERKIWPSTYIPNVRGVAAIKGSKQKSPCFEIVYVDKIYKLYWHNGKGFCYIIAKSFHRKVFEKFLEWALC